MQLKEDDCYYVYLLVDPINQTPFYIGKGKNKRAWDHIKGYDKSNSKKSKYIDNIRALGFEPEVHILLENLSNQYARLYEASCIQYGKSIRLPLTNIKTFEGENPWSKETRKKVSDTMKRKCLRPPSRKGVRWKENAVSKVDSKIKHSIIEIWKAKELTEKLIQNQFNISRYVLKGILKEANLI